jgi:hypothetical protein
MSGLRWPPFRFSLRTFLIVCVLPVPFLAWIASVKLSAVRQRQAINHFQSRGFYIGYDDVGQSSPGLVKTICDAVDPHVLLRVTYLDATQPLDRQDIEHLSRLQGLSNLHFHRQGVQPKPGEYTIGENDVRRIASIHTLASITLDAPLQADSIGIFLNLPELDSLMLPQAKVDSHFLEALSKKPRMAALEFDGSRLDPAALSQLSKLPLLQTLVIHHLAPNTLQSLSECRALTGLALYDSHLSIADAHAIQKLRCRTLDLVNPAVEKGFFRKLEKHPTILRITVQRGTEYFSTSSTANGESPITLAELEYCEDHFTTDEGNGK